MNRPSILPYRIRQSCIAPALGSALLALACAKTPPPPDSCNLVQVDVDWGQFHPIPLQVNLDSLGSLVARTKDDGARAHRLEEYLFAANRLEPRARQEALASVTRLLEQVRKP